MNNKDELALEKREAQAPAEVERFSPRKVFTPRADIYETRDHIVVLADMPGVDEQSVDITLEKNILTLTGRTHELKLPGHKLAYAEYDTGDYQRVFTLSDEVDRDGIQAVVKNGVLRLTLPKVAEAKSRKIVVKAA